MKNKADVRHTLNMARLSGAAYKDLAEAKKEFHRQGFKEIVFIESLGTQVYLLKKKGRIVIVFRGTQIDEVADIMTDLKFKQVQFLIGMVHQGFKDACELVMKEIVDKLFDWYEDEKIIITGHSLGGSLSTICAVKLRLEHSYEDIDIITYGSPRVGNKEFKNSYNKILGKRTVRTVNDEDLVPKLPTNIGMKYYHVEDLHFIDDNYSLRDVPNWYPYAANLLEYFVDFCKLKGLPEIKVNSEREALKEMIAMNAKECVQDHSIDSYILSLEKCLQKLGKKSEASI